MGSQAEQRGGEQRAKQGRKRYVVATGIRCTTHWHAHWHAPSCCVVTDATKALGKSGSGSIFDETLQCAFCCNLCERPVTVRLQPCTGFVHCHPAQAPCQHNFCLKCFQKWVGTGKKTCPTCRHSFPASFASNPRINTALTVAIRMAKLVRRRMARSNACTVCTG